MQRIHDYFTKSALRRTVEDFLVARDNLIRKTLEVFHSYNYSALLVQDDLKAALSDLHSIALDISTLHPIGSVPLIDISFNMLKYIDTLITTTDKLISAISKVSTLAGPGYEIINNLIATIRREGNYLNVVQLQKSATTQRDNLAQELHIKAVEEYETRPDRAINRYITYLVQLAVRQKTLASPGLTNVIKFCDILIEEWPILTNALLETKLTDFSGLLSLLESVHAIANTLVEAMVIAYGVSGARTMMQIEKRWSDRRPEDENSPKSPYELYYQYALEDIKRAEAAYKRKLAMDDVALLFGTEIGPEQASEIVFAPPRQRKHTDAAK